MSSATPLPIAPKSFTLIKSPNPSEIGLDMALGTETAFTDGIKLFDVDPPIPLV